MTKQVYRVQRYTPIFNYDLLIDHVSYQLSLPARESDHDFFPLLEKCSAHFEVSSDFLLQKGFRKAYRQILEGL